ncbi:MAG: NAD-dependent epimerase/dehydratase family protein [Actinomycetota bacterium]|nr:NAD-dependent epimerase/dehydratase family protein [Actinomycetota bacterium]
MGYPWSSKSVLVTGGASFIGSTLVGQLLDRGAKVRVADDFSSGVYSNISDEVERGDVELVRGDLRDREISDRAVRGTDVIFHLAADHGGRGYVDLHQYACSTNLGLDATLFAAALDAGVETITYASSGCIYPLYLQADLGQTLYLTEDMAGAPGYDPDGMYGLAKLAGELTLKALHDEYGMKTASCRYFTVYGPRGVENHAVIAMIARTFMRQDPFQVWGTGEQVRNWTYVDDIVAGTILAAEKIEDGTAVNLGTMERVRVLDAVEMVCKLAGYSPEIELQTDMPVGPLNRIADNSLARDLLGWEPPTNFEEGLKKTQEWYFSSKNVDEVRAIFDHMLTGRGAPQSDPVLAGASAGEDDRVAGA